MGLPSTKEDIDAKAAENLTPSVVARASQIQADPHGRQVVESHRMRVRLEAEARVDAIAEGLRVWEEAVRREGGRPSLIDKHAERKRLGQEFDKHSAGSKHR